MNTATATKTINQSQHPCGFCSTGNHGSCPGGVLNGNQTEIMTCGCTQHPQVIRCLDCNKRTPHGDDAISTDTWTCTDIEYCQQQLALKREKALRDLYGEQGPRDARRPRESKETRTKAPRTPKTGSCVCCAEPTKGGMFLPGHDSRYLSRTADAVRGGVVSLDATLQAWAKRGISEALQGKLTKRVGA